VKIDVSQAALGRCDGIGTCFRKPMNRSSHQME